MNSQTHINSIYEQLNQSSRGAILWDSLTHEERSFFCVVAKVGKKTDVIETAKKKLCELNDLERIRILKKIQGLSRLTAPFSNLSRYEFK
ncbi:hypothetical protein [Psychromonas sp. Urea-02u-13]|uniref:hypothetical protein n=1 Tax=Psychromonas sp. Urea-02u-13 TaxID=2058326 RepID=UPI000C33B084|nr:hypothetical protein [Psychromonas sp. Urea-02u-13]PKG39712.1 hypothetical protein CXF74_07100 [Psychromonas sp. Urea-02u-13]